MKKVYVIFEYETDRLYEHVFYKTEEDAERRVNELKEYGYKLYVMPLNRFYEKDDFIEIAD